METVTDRIARLNLIDISASRLESLTLAHPYVDDETFVRIREAVKVMRNSHTIVLPAHHFEGLSRGRGWARKGRGKNVHWGERVDNGYRVGTGSWTIGGNDGFKRKGEHKWNVAQITVGAATWTIAN